MTADERKAISFHAIYCDCERCKKVKWVCGHCTANKPTQYGACPHCYCFPTVHRPTRALWEEFEREATN